MFYFNLMACERIEMLLWKHSHSSTKKFEMPDDADKVCDNVLLTNLIKGLQYSVNKLHCEQTG